MVFETTADNVLHETGMCTSLPLAKNVPMQTQTLQNPTYPGWWLSRICIVAVLVRKIQNQSVGCKSSETHRRLLFLLLPRAFAHDFSQFNLVPATPDSFTSASPGYQTINMAKIQTRRFSSFAGFPVTHESYANNFLLCEEELKHIYTFLSPSAAPFSYHWPRGRASETCLGHLIKAFVIEPRQGGATVNVYA